MRELTPAEQDAVRQAVNDMRIEGFRITENRALELARQTLATEMPKHSAEVPDLARRIRRRIKMSV